MDQASKAKHAPQESSGSAWPQRTLFAPGAKPVDWLSMDEWLSERANGLAGGLYYAGIAWLQKSGELGEERERERRRSRKQHGWMERIRLTFTGRQGKRGQTRQGIGLSHGRSTRVG
jgi:hypothetical protein